VALDWAFDLLRDMRAEGVQATIVTYNALIHACARAGRADRAFEVLDVMRRERITPDIVTLCSLVDACGRAGMLEQAFATIRELPLEFGSLEPNLPTYNALISACARAGNLERLTFVYRELYRVGLKPNIVTYSTIITAYSYAHDMDRAMSALARMRRRNLRPNQVTFTAVVAAFARLGKVDRALAVFEEARAICGKPDEELYAAAFVAAATGKRPDIATRLAGEMEAAGYDVQSALSRVILQGGRVERSGDELSSLLVVMETLGIKPSRAVCEAVVSVYSAEGNVKAAFEILHVMNRLRYPPNLRTYKKLIECCGLAMDLPRAQQLFGALRGNGEEPRRSRQFNTHHWIELYEVMLRTIMRIGSRGIAVEYLASMRRDCGEGAANSAELRIIDG
jgi:pentatricopeptide repeat protein